MSVAIQKIQGVESVSVSLNKGLASIRLKPGNTVRIEQLREAVERNGFSPKDANVTALGQVVSVGGKLQFKVLGVDQTYDLLVDSAARQISEEVKRETGKTVIIEGVIPAPHPPRNAKAPLVIHLKAVRQAGAK